MTTVGLPQPDMTTGLPRCTKCRDRLLRDRDGVLACLSCGKEHVMPETPSPLVRQSVPAGTATATPPPAPAAAPSWLDLARTELDGLLRRIADVDEAKAQAERLWRSLSVYGVEGLPALPWDTKPTPRPAAAKAPLLVSRDCVRCGQRFPSKSGRQYRRVGDGTRALCLVCKDGMRVDPALWEANAAHGYKA